MNLVELWPLLLLGTPATVYIPFTVEKIEAYPAGAEERDSLCNMMPILKLSKFLFCYDILIRSKIGKLIRVLLSPMLSSIQRGCLKSGSSILVKTIQKVNIQGYFLVISNWENYTEMEKNNNGWLLLSEYKSTEVPLCNRDSSLLSIWTLQFFEWKNRGSIHKVTKVRNDTQLGSLSRLDEEWTTLTTKFNLVVRVLAKSKIRILLQQENKWKPWMAICNLLVADNTAYTVVTVWDEAVREFCHNVCEGDILFLNGSYKVSRYASSKLSYKLEPKRRINLSPTEIEIKLNFSDLRNVRIGTSSSTENVPPPIWNFITTDNLFNEVLGDGRIVDFVGCLVYYGRWEREKCHDTLGRLTGQFWVRVWLMLADHTSDSVIKLKLFIHLETWEEMELLLPGDVVALTNLKINKDEHSSTGHMIGTNETQIFTKMKLYEERFKTSEAVSSLVLSCSEDFDKWVRILDRHGGIGGYMPPLKSFNKKGEKKNNIFGQP